MATPFVSVLIDTYNHEQFIERAISSVLGQNYPASNREIVVVDDGSTDRTPEQVRKFAPEVRLIRKRNGGQASAFNAGIPECRGEIIAFLDGDDWWQPTKLSTVVKVMAGDKTIAMVGHAIRESFPEGVEKIVAPENAERFRLNSLAAARVFRMRKSYLGTSRMSLRAEIVRQILPVPEQLVIEADEYLFTIAAALGDIVILREPLTHYAIHGANLYMSAGTGGPGLRRKQQVIATLASCLPEQLSSKGVPADAVRCVVEIIQAEADQLRLMLEGGFPWETFRVERKIYDVLHGDASSAHRLFRAATMSLALLLPPKWFYGGRHWVGSQSWYRRARKKALPMPQMTHVPEAEEFKV